MAASRFAEVRRTGTGDPPGRRCHRHGREGLSAEIERLAGGSQPHRALWDTIAAALLLPALIAKAWPASATLTDLLGIAAIDLQTPFPVKTSEAVTQDTLFGAAE